MPTYIATYSRWEKDTQILKDMEKNADTGTTDRERQTDWSHRLSGAVGVCRMYRGRKAASAPGVHRACQAYLCPQVWWDSSESSYQTPLYLSSPGGLLPNIKCTIQPTEPLHTPVLHKHDCTRKFKVMKKPNPSRSEFLIVPQHTLPLPVFPET